MRIARIVVTALLLLSALILEVTMLSRLPIPGATPDLVLVVVVALAIGYGPGFGALTGFAAGLGADLLPPADGAIGRWALVFALVGYGAGLIGPGMRGSVLLRALVVGVASFASVVAYATTGWLLDESLVSWGVVNRLIPTSVAYAVVLSPFVVSAVLAVVRRLDPAPVVVAN